jgi:hypothetical protein
MWLLDYPADLVAAELVEQQPGGHLQMAVLAQQDKVLQGAMDLVLLLLEVVVVVVLEPLVLLAHPLD